MNKDSGQKPTQSETSITQKTDDVWTTCGRRVDDVWNIIPVVEPTVSSSLRNHLFFFSKKSRMAALTPRRSDIAARICNPATLGA